MNSSGWSLYKSQNQNVAQRAAEILENPETTYSTVPLIPHYPPTLQSAPALLMHCEPWKTTFQKTRVPKEKTFNISQDRLDRHP